MSRNSYSGLRLVPRQRHEMLIRPDFLLVQKLLMAPALTSSTERKIVVPASSAKTSSDKGLVNEVAHLIKHEDASDPLSDREILTRVSSLNKYPRITTQTIARARYQLGLPPSVRRKR
jgi:DNA-directed RNA polymerase specialized sigma54-like protein